MTRTVPIVPGTLLRGVTTALAAVLPATLGLWHWAGSTWSDSGITVLARDAASRTLSVALAHMSEYALFAAAPTDLQEAPEPRAGRSGYLPAIRN